MKGIEERNGKRSQNAEAREQVKTACMWKDARRDATTRAGENAGMYATTYAGMYTTTYAGMKVTTNALGKMQACMQQSMCVEARMQVCNNIRAWNLEALIPVCNNACM